MSWILNHRKSAEYAALAEAATQNKDYTTAQKFYLMAAELESTALSFVPSEKQRTAALTRISAAALWYKAGKYAYAQQIAADGLNGYQVPAFAKLRLRKILRAAQIAAKDQK